MNENNQEISLTENGKKLLSSWDVNAAMRDIYDTVEMMLMPYVLLGDAARQLKDGVDGFNGNELKVDKLQWGFPIRNLNPETLSLIHQWNWKEEKYGFSYDFNEVPIEVHVFQKKYKFLDLPDMCFYGPDMFKIPNPFNSYWPMRHML